MIQKHQARTCHIWIILSFPWKPITSEISIRPYLDISVAREDIYAHFVSSFQVEPYPLYSLTMWFYWILGESRTLVHRVCNVWLITLFQSRYACLWQCDSESVGQIFLHPNIFPVCLLWVLEYSLELLSTFIRPNRILFGWWVVDVTDGMYHCPTFLCLIPGNLRYLPLQWYPTLLPWYQLQST